MLAMLRCVGWDSPECPDRVRRRPVMIASDNMTVQTLCERARAEGAGIVAELKDFEFGERQYTAEDPAGHHWTFSETIADIAPEEWGGGSIPPV